VRTLDFRTTPGMMICFVSTSHVSPLHYHTFLAACSKCFLVQSGRSKRRVPGWWSKWKRSVGAYKKSDNCFTPETTLQDLLDRTEREKVQRV
jgi:hypothetical protein